MTKGISRRLRDCCKTLLAVMDSGEGLLSGAQSESKTTKETMQRFSQDFRFGILRHWSMHPTGSFATTIL
jgi:hypothetical protein